VIGFLAWQAEQHLSPMASMGPGSKPSVRFAPPEGKVSNYRFYASNDEFRAHSVDSDAIAPQAMAGDDLATLSRGDVSTLAAIVPPPAATKPMPSSAPVFAGGGVRWSRTGFNTISRLGESAGDGLGRTTGSRPRHYQSGQRAELSVSSATGAVQASLQSVLWLQKIR
jgi:hypothetical protein